MAIILFFSKMAVICQREFTIVRIWITHEEYLLAIVNMQNWLDSVQ